MPRLRSFMLVLAASSLILSCASQPAPAPQPAEQKPATEDDSAAKERAKQLVQGGAYQSPQQQGSQDSAGASGQQTQQPDQNSAGQPQASQSETESLPAAQLSPEESAYLQTYLSRLNYMVYYRDDSQTDPSLARIAVSQANRYLIEKMGLSVIDFDQIEKNKKDQQTAYQAETGGSISLIQYLAQKFNADVYLELDFTVSSEVKDSKYYASAQGSIKIFDPSTATLLGSVAFISQPSFSPNSMDAAITNAVAASVWMAMPKATSQSKELMKNSMARGIRYELIVQKTPDSKQMSQFRRALSKKVREAEMVSYSPDATKFYLYSFSGKDKIEDGIYDAADAVNLPDINLVYMRGKSYTFNSGL